MMVMCMRWQDNGIVYLYIALLAAIAIIVAVIATSKAFAGSSFKGMLYMLAGAAAFAAIIKLPKNVGKKVVISYGQDSDWKEDGTKAITVSKKGLKNALENTARQNDAIFARKGMAVKIKEVIDHMPVPFGVYAEGHGVGIEEELSCAIEQSGLGEVYAAFDRMIAVDREPVRIIERRLYDTYVEGTGIDDRSWDFEKALGRIDSVVFYDGCSLNMKGVIERIRTTGGCLLGVINSMAESALSSRLLLYEKSSSVLMMLLLTGFLKIEVIPASGRNKNYMA